MSDYIDGFIFPIPKTALKQYQNIASEVAQIWKEYGALTYAEFVGDDLTLAGTRSFADTTGLTDDEVVIFGWVSFPSKEVRDSANKLVPSDSRMSDLVAPLTSGTRKIFDAGRMIYGGFKSLIIK